MGTLSRCDISLALIVIQAIDDLREERKQLYGRPCKTWVTLLKCLRAGVMAEAVDWKCFVLRCDHSFGFCAPSYKSTAEQYGPKGCGLLSVTTRFTNNLRDTLANLVENNRKKKPCCPVECGIQSGSSERHEHFLFVDQINRRARGIIEALAHPDLEQPSTLSTVDPGREPRQDVLQTLPVTAVASPTTPVAAQPVHCDTGKHLPQTDRTQVGLQLGRFPLFSASDEEFLEKELGNDLEHLWLQNDQFMQFSKTAAPYVADFDLTKETIPENAELQTPQRGREMAATFNHVNKQPDWQLYQRLTKWCAIVYWEMAIRIGNPFIAEGERRCVDVDGFGNWSEKGKRFSLGPLPNPSRSQEIEEVRWHIGKGVRLFCIGNEVFARCLSTSKVFIQSKHANHIDGVEASTVRKLTQGCTMRIFSFCKFLKQLNEAAQRGYEAVYEVSMQCSIRISFAKGWGGKYFRRKVIETPCWISVDLNEPLLWSDNVLSKMSPKGPVSSRS